MNTENQILRLSPLFKDDTFIVKSFRTVVLNDLVLRCRNEIYYTRFVLTRC